MFGSNEDQTLSDEQAGADRLPIMVTFDCLINWNQTILTRTLRPRMEAHAVCAVSMLLLMTMMILILILMRMGWGGGVGGHVHHQTTHAIRW